MIAEQAGIDPVLKDVKVLVSIYAPGAIDPMFSNALFQSIAGVRTGVSYGGGDCAWRTHNAAIKAALEGRFTHILFLHPDVRPPRQALKYLLERGVDAVGAVQYHARSPHSPMAYLRTPDGTYASVEPRGEGLQEVHSIVMGCLLVKTDALKGVKGPWLIDNFNEDGSLHLGAEHYFCEILSGAGAKLHVDFDVQCTIAVQEQIGEQEAMRDWRRLMASQKHGDA